MPYFLYVNVGLGCPNSRCTNRLNVIFNSCIRYVCNLRRRDHVTPYARVSLECTLNNYLKYRNCVFMFNLLKSQSPLYVFKNITRNASERKKNVMIPRSKGRCLQSSFYTNSAGLWNDLPNSIKHIDWAIFKRDCL